MKVMNAATKTCPTCGQKHSLKLTCLGAWLSDLQKAGKAQGEIVNPKGE